MIPLMTVTTQASGGGFDLTLKLATDQLLPGHLVRDVAICSTTEA